MIDCTAGLPSPFGKHRVAQNCAGVRAVRVYDLLPQRDFSKDPAVPFINGFSALLVAMLISPLASAGVYSPDDFYNGVRAYEMVYGGVRQRDPRMEGSAFEFLGYVKALTDSNNGIAFCIRQDAFPKAVSLLVKQYNRQPEWRDVDPPVVVVEALRSAFPCGTPPVITRP
ncbi:MAG: hypothetical protein IPJ21_02590 [Sterolibacteriaceae bacterium]|nr:hypothetical protein [Sterolibacteriaceae bacterium]MBK9086549.1 hypothetical protein [Sterolibacteriaceae bacterium]